MALFGHSIEKLLRNRLTLILPMRIGELHAAPDYDWEDRFLCLELNEEDLPWDVKQRNW